MIRKAIEKALPKRRRAYPIPSGISDDYDEYLFNRAIDYADLVLHDVINELSGRDLDGATGLDVHDEIVEYLTYG